YRPKTAGSREVCRVMATTAVQRAIWTKDSARRVQAAGGRRSGSRAGDNSAAAEDTRISLQQGIRVAVPIVLLRHFDVLPSHSRREVMVCPQTLDGIDHCRDITYPRMDAGEFERQGGDNGASGG